MSDEILDHADVRDVTNETALSANGKAMATPQATIAHARHPSEDLAVREMIIDFIVWNQEMEGIPSDRERVAASYDDVLHERESVFDP